MVEGRSATQIAEDIFSSKSTALKALKQHGIPIREPHLHHGNPGEVRFGKKIWGGREINHAAEQKVIEAVLQMKASNMGLRQIARLLTQMEISTKYKSAIWHPEMIRRILSRQARCNPIEKTATIS